MWSIPTLSTWIVLVGATTATWMVGTVTADHMPVYSLHGSGTTNPSKCYWAILEQFVSRSKLPLKLGYRAVGSSTGHKEFSQEPALIEFASGDIPIPADIYADMQARDIEVFHLPVLLGTVSMFHSVPLVADHEKLNLTSCLLARIFLGQLDRWSHPDIVEWNPNLRSDLPIRVVVRADGSSSTTSVTEYLHSACGEIFPEALVESQPEWDPDFPRCEGSGGVTKCILEQPGTIGYIDSGHGWSADLDEVDLQNLDGEFLDSRQALEREGVDDVDVSAFPIDPSDDFSNVTLVNLPGAHTWPIIQATYIYVRANNTFLENPDEQSLLIAFLRALVDDKYVGQCRDSFGFTLPSQQIQDYTTAAIDKLEANLSPGANRWIFEDSTLPINGTGNYVLSVKRSQISDVQIAEVTADVRDLENLMTLLQTDLKSTQAQLNTGTNNSNGPNATAALTLASLSFAFWMIYLIYLAWSWFTKK